MICDLSCAWIAVRSVVDNATLLLKLGKYQHGYHDQCHDQAYEPQEITPVSV